MIEIKINNADEITAKLEQLAQGVERREPLMRSISGTMYSAVMQNFGDGGRPSWLGPKYRAGKPLIDTGALRGSISEDSGNEHAVVGTNLIYAAIHNFGGVIRPKSAKALAIPTATGVAMVKQVTIPKREFMTLTPRDESDIEDDIQTYFQNIIR